MGNVEVTQVVEKPPFILRELQGERSTALYMIEHLPFALVEAFRAFVSR
jgi:hypothetical protein